MTEFIPAQLAKPAPKNKPLSDPFWADYILEPKHDGMRAIVVKDSHGNVSIQSRTDKPYAAHVPALVKLFSRLPNDTVVDGELAVVRKSVDIRDIAVPVVDFNATMRIMGSGAAKAVSRQEDTIMFFIIFDVTKYDGADITDLTQDYRRGAAIAVESYFSMEDPVILNPQFRDEDDYQEIYDRLVLNGIEGAILKNSEATYMPGKRQNKAWYKFKTTGTADVVVTGFTDAKEGVGGKYLGQIGAIKFGAYDENGVLHEVGQTSGMTDALRLWWTEVRDAFDVTASPTPIQHGDLPYVIEVKYNDLVGTGEYKTPRHPQYVTLRTDKYPSDCLMEQFKS